MRVNPDGLVRRSATVDHRYAWSLNLSRWQSALASVSPVGTSEIEMRFDSSPTVQTTDVDEASDILRRVYIPTVIVPIGPKRLNLRLNAAQLPALTAGYVHFGTDVIAAAKDVSDYYVNMPLSGAVMTRWADGQSETITTGSAAVFTPGTPAAITWPDDCGQLCIKVTQQTMHPELEALLNRPARKAVTFARHLNLT